MPNLEKRKMSSKADLKTVLKISGSKSNRYSNPKQVYNSSDYELSNFIHINLNKRSVRKLQTTLIRQYQASMKVSSAKVDGADINITDQITYSIGDEESHFNATKASELILGRGLWWEILISYHLDKNKENYSHFMNVEFISETNNILNEIDILLFDSRTLHFIEAKSGSVKQSDINKIVAVRNLYGSVLSHSFLISRYKPRPDILEKCKNLGIHVIVYGKTSNEKTFTSIRNLNELAKIVNTKLNLRRI